MKSILSVFLEVVLTVRKFSCQGGLSRGGLQAKEFTFVCLLFCYFWMEGAW